MPTPRKALSLFPEDSETGSATVRPPLKWAGGKRWQVSELRCYWGQEGHRRLVEPFCGGLALPLGLRPERALLNDLNPHLINFYRQVQRGLRLTIETENDRRLFYAHRDRFNFLIREAKSKTAESAQVGNRLR